MIRLETLETWSLLVPPAQESRTRAQPTILSDYCCLGRSLLTERVYSVYGAMAIWAPVGSDSRLLVSQDRLAHVVLPQLVHIVACAADSKLELPSVQPSKAAMICNTWNFFGSALSNARKCRK